MKTLETFFVIVAILLAVFKLLPAGLNYSGFCMEQGRWLSDEEKIKIVILSGFIKKPNIAYSFRYESFEDFMKQNPDCCRVDTTISNTEIPDPDFWSKIYDYYTGVVVVKFANNHINSSEKSPIESSFMINNCGKDYDWL